ncbi:MAG: hypothetical protein IPL61_03210 [Myxococcales bacterium]|nr:hypothetical protein [Myxococcales bacterium]
MSNTRKDPFTLIAPAALTPVAGGRRSAGSSRAAQDDRMMDTLTSIERAIKDLGRNANTGPDPMSQLMPILALSMMNQPPPPQIITCGRRRRC